MTYLSVITPVYNNVEYIEKCILSVLNQNHGDIEHLITDGGSTDGSGEWLQYYERMYPDKIRCIYEKNDIGALAQVNNMIKLAQGEIIGFLPADDMYCHDAADIVKNHFSSNPKSMCLYGSCIYMDYKTGKMVNTIEAKPFDLKELINGRFYVYGASMFYRKEVFSVIGDLLGIAGRIIVKKDETPVADLDLLIRAGAVFGFDYTPHALTCFRMRPWSLSGKSWEKTKRVLKASHLVTQKYGAGRLSWSARAYFISMIIDFIRPVLGFMYPMVDKIVEKKRLA